MWAARLKPSSERKLARDGLQTASPLARFGDRPEQVSTIVISVPNTMNNKKGYIARAVMSISETQQLPLWVKRGIQNPMETTRIGFLNIMNICIKSLVTNVIINL